jgi:lipid A 3-O-deacylase
MGLLNFLSVSCALMAIAAVGYIGAAPAALAQSRPSDTEISPLIDEVRLGLLAHAIETNNSEDGAEVNFEVLFRRPTAHYDNAFWDLVLRPRFHLGTSISTLGETNQFYAGFTWDGQLTQKLLLELSFGGSLNDGPTGDQDNSYGCPLNFRESASLGYPVNERWTVYGTIAHMSNARLCDHNTGITSVGVRLGYKLDK